MSALRASASWRSSALSSERTYRTGAGSTEASSSADGECPTSAIRRGSTELPFSAARRRSSINTSYRSPYEDEETEEGFLYAYRAGDVNQPDNRALREAFSFQVPLVTSSGPDPVGTSRTSPASSSATNRPRDELSSRRERWSVPRRAGARVARRRHRAPVRRSRGESPRAPRAFEVVSFPPTRRSARSAGSRRLACSTPPTSSAILGPAAKPSCPTA
jgi:hypothetical protein